MQLTEKSLFWHIVIDKGQKHFICDPISNQNNQNENPLSDQNDP